MTIQIRMLYDGNMDDIIARFNFPKFEVRETPFYTYLLVDDADAQLVHDNIDIAMELLESDMIDYFSVTV